MYNINDRIIITSNDYDLQVMNGMIGKIIDIYQDIEEVDMIEILFDGEEESRKINKEKILPIIKLAYIITIHKSQGSEDDIVVILLDNNNIINNINLLYTAITRAKKKCILISEEDTIKNIILTKKIIKRKSNLKKFCML